MIVGRFPFGVVRVICFVYLRTYMNIPPTSIMAADVPQARGTNEAKFARGNMQLSSPNR